MDTCCVNCYIYKRHPQYPCARHRSRGDGAACDSCVKMGRLCVRWMLSPEGEHLVIYPLPEEQRENESWEDTGFWLVEDEDEGEDEGEAETWRQ